MTMTSPGLTEVEAVGDIGALLVNLQQLQPQPHLHQQETNTFTLADTVT